MKGRAIAISVAAAALFGVALLVALAAGQSLAQDTVGGPVVGSAVGAVVKHGDVAQVHTSVTTSSLLVIAPEEFRFALQPLIDHKNASGMSTIMVTLEDLYGEFSGADRPDQIKHAIAFYEQTLGIEYVMLVGDVNKFPVRWQAGQLVDNNLHHVYLPSDYYYADLYDGIGAFNNWDADGDRYYGEIYRTNLNPDGIDFDPDVKVGRVTAADVTQVETYVAKVIRYEYLASNSDWFPRVLLIQDGFTGDIDAKENIAGYLSGFEPVRLYEHISPADYSGPVSDTISPITISLRFNEGAGFVSHTSHGSPARWYNVDTFYRIANIRSDLRNAYTLPVIYSGGCQTTQFFYETVPYCRSTDCPTWRYLGEDGSLHAGVPVTVPAGLPSFYPRPAVTQTHNELGIGEAFVVETDSGGIAYFGSQETGQVGTHRVLDEAFFEAYSLGHHILGNMWEYALERFATVYSVGSVSPTGHWWPTCLVHTPSRYILFGDPSLRVGGVAGLVDTLPPGTVLDTDWADWHNEPVDVRLWPSDYGTPPSGVRVTLYQVDGGPWQRGRRFTIEAPRDHSNDGEHLVGFRSVDFLSNTESLQGHYVRIDTARPDTDVLLNGEPPAMVFCTPSSPCPAIGCYNTSVSVTLTATDDASGVASTWYELNGASHEYSATFSVYGGAVLRWRPLDYWSYDNAGNREWPEETGFCVSNWRAGLMVEQARILAALEEIVAMRMRQEFASTLPPIQAVDFEYLDPQQAWQAIGTDNDGTDGWGVQWDTTQVLDGDYATRMTAWGFPPPQATTAPQQPPMLYQEQVTVTVYNVPDSAYQFDLYVPSSEADRGETLTYTLKFVNQTDSDLTNLNMTCDMDVGFFDEITVQDGGSTDQQGMPTWSLAKLDAGATWQTHFTARTRQDLVPGTAIASQAILTADTVPQLLSDDPTTPEEDDWTAVTVRLVDASIAGRIEDADDGSALEATVIISGPISRTVSTDISGYYWVMGLPPGTYSVSVEADGYDYHSPTGPVNVTLDGTIDGVTVNFFLRRADARPPYSTLSSSVDEIVQGSVTQLSGTAHDPASGSGVSMVEVSIRCANDGTHWDGAQWGANETWLQASGTTEWTYDCSNVTWDSNHAYTIKTRATDGAGNLEVPVAYPTTPDAPTLLSPADGASTNDARPAFDWSDVPDAQYILEVDNDSDFSSPEIHEPYLLPASTYTPDAGLAAGTYYWHVRAVAGLGVLGEWSETWTLTIAPSRIYLPLVLRF